GTAEIPSGVISKARSCALPIGLSLDRTIAFRLFQAHKLPGVFDRTDASHSCVLDLFGAQFDATRIGGNTIPAWSFPRNRCAVNARPVGFFFRWRGWGEELRRLFSHSGLLRCWR